MSNLNQGVLDGVRRVGARVRDLAIDGQVTGAPLGFRLRGATTAGPPVTGTWKAGDETRDRNGAIWICTTGGTPGIWTQPGVQAWIPADNALLIANGDPAAFQATLIATAGTVYLQKLVARQQVTITNLWYNISTAGNNTGGSTGTFVGLYSSSGTLLSGSPDVAASLTTQAPASLALTTPQTVSAGSFVWAAIMCNLGTTQPTFFRGLGGATTSGNGGLTAATYRWAVNGTIRTTLPSPIVPSSNTGTTMTAWAGGS